MEIGFWFQTCFYTIFQSDIICVDWMAFSRKSVPVRMSSTVCSNLVSLQSSLLSARISARPWQPHNLKVLNLTAVRRKHVLPFLDRLRLKRRRSLFLFRHAAISRISSHVCSFLRPQLASNWSSLSGPFGWSISEVPNRLEPTAVDLLGG